MSQARISTVVQLRRNLYPSFCQCRGQHVRNKSPTLVEVPFIPGVPIADRGGEGFDNTERGFVGVRHLPPRLCEPKESKMSRTRVDTSDRSTRNPAGHDIHSGHSMLTVPERA